MASGSRLAARLDLGAGGEDVDRDVPVQHLGPPEGDGAARRQRAPRVRVVDPVQRAQQRRVADDEAAQGGPAAEAPRLPAAPVGRGLVPAGARVPGRDANARRAARVGEAVGHLGDDDGLPDGEVRRGGADRRPRGAQHGHGLRRLVVHERHAGRPVRQLRLVGAPVVVVRGRHHHEERRAARDSGEHRGHRRGAARPVAGGVAQREPGRRGQRAAQPAREAHDRRAQDDEADDGQRRAARDQHRDGVALARAEAAGLAGGGPEAAGGRGRDAEDGQRDARGAGPHRAPLGARPAAAQPRDHVLARRRAGGDDGGEQAGHHGERGDGEQLERAHVEAREGRVGVALQRDAGERGGQDASRHARDGGHHAEDEAAAQHDQADVARRGARRGEQRERPPLAAGPDREGRTREQDHLERGEPEDRHAGEDREERIGRPAPSIPTSRVVGHRGARAADARRSCGRRPGRPCAVEREHLAPGQRLRADRVGGGEGVVRRAARRARRSASRAARTRPRCRACRPPARAPTMRSSRSGSDRASRPPTAAPVRSRSSGVARTSSRPRGAAARQQLVAARERGVGGAHLDPAHVGRPAARVATSTLVAVSVRTRPPRGTSAAGSA